MTAPTPPDLPQGLIPTLTEVVNPAQLRPTTAPPWSQSCLQQAEPVLAQCVAQATEHVLQSWITRHAAHLRAELQEELTLALRQAMLGAFNEPVPTNTLPSFLPDVPASTDTSSLPQQDQQL